MGRGRCGRDATLRPVSPLEYAYRVAITDWIILGCFVVAYSAWWHTVNKRHPPKQGKIGPIVDFGLYFRMFAGLMIGSTVLRIILTKT